MSLPSIQSNNSYIPKFKGKKTISAGETAGKTFSTNASFGKAVLPSKADTTMYVRSRSTKINYQAAKASNMSSRLNSGQVTSNRSVGLYGAMGVSSGYSAQNFNMDATGSAWQQLGYGLAQLGMQYGDKFGLFGSNNSEKVEAATPKTPEQANVSGEISASVNAMRNATNSSELRTAISLAENQYNEMLAQSPELEQAAKDAQSQMKDLQAGVGTAEKAVKDNEGLESQAQQSVNALQTKLESLNSDYAAKVKGYDTACTNLDKATTALTQAEQNLATANSEVSGAEADLSRAQAMPAGTPAQQAAKQAAIAKATAALNAAKAKQAEAQAKKTEAETNKAEAQTAKDAAAKAKEEAYNAITENKEEIKNAESKLDKAKEQVKTAKQKVEESKKDLEKAKENLQTANDNIEKFSANSKNMNDLQREIKAQKQALAKMEKSELKEYDKINKQTAKTDAKNEKLWSGIDASDGMSKKEIKKLNKISANNAANEARAVRAAELQDPVEETKKLMSDKNFAKQLVGRGTEVTLQVGYGTPPIKGYYGKNPETGNMVYADANGAEYTEEAFNNWRRLAETGSLDS